jgi:hypothetical protein
MPAVAVGSQSTAGSIENVGILFIKAKANNLVSMDMASSSDPYLILKLGTQSMRTRTGRDDNDPVWREALSLNVGKWGIGSIVYYPPPNSVLTSATSSELNLTLHAAASRSDADDSIVIIIILLLLLLLWIAARG